MGRNQLAEKSAPPIERALPSPISVRSIGWGVKVGEEFIPEDRGFKQYKPKKKTQKYANKTKIISIKKNKKK